MTMSINSMPLNLVIYIAPGIKVSGSWFHTHYEIMRKQKLEVIEFLIILFSFAIQNTSFISMIKLYQIV